MARPRRTQEDKNRIAEEGKALRDWRKSRSLTQAELAALISDGLATPISSQSVARYEQGKSEIPVAVRDYLRQYCRDAKIKPPAFLRLSATRLTDSDIKSLDEAVNQFADDHLSDQQGEVLKQLWAGVRVKETADAGQSASDDGKDSKPIPSEGKALDRTVTVAEGNALRNWRKSIMHLSQRELADEIDKQIDEYELGENKQSDENDHLGKLPSSWYVDLQKVSRWENGRTKIPAVARKGLLLLSKARGVDPPEINYDSVAKYETFVEDTHALVSLLLNDEENVRHNK